MVTNCSYSKEFNLLTSCNIIDTVISVNWSQHQLISQKKLVNSYEITRDAGCYRPRANVEFWRWKHLFTITDVWNFPVPEVYFHEKKKLFQITPDIFCTVQHLYLRMFSRCLCFYETYNNKVVIWWDNARNVRTRALGRPGKTWTLTSPHTKLVLFIRGQQRCILFAFP